MNTTAFPRVPVETADVTDSLNAQGVPPAIPFDTLVRAAEQVGKTLPTGRNARTRALCAQITPTLDSQDARDFLKALAFMGTLGM
jgi:hypothetical protein